MVNGIVNVYKEAGYTSFDVVAKMRGIFHQKKVGHTGTLDPDATGVLPVCLGKATKVCDMLTDRDKTYKAVMLLGVQTDTLDISGKVLNTADVNVSKEQVYDAVGRFVGEIMQIPPMYSALKVNGKKLCDLARAGVYVERKPRPVTIYSIDIESIKLPEVTMNIHCSKGTYIRTLCDDIGNELGCFGCMKSLVRTKACGFDLEDAYTLDEIEKIKEQTVVAVDKAFFDLEKVTALKEANHLIANGNKLPVELISNEANKNTEYKDGKSYRLYDSSDVFVGVFEFVLKTMEFKPIKIFYG